MSYNISEKVLAELESIVGKENISYSKIDLIAYSRDWSIVTAIKGYPPDVVVKPKSSTEISQIMQLANREKIPVVPWGGGTGMSGGAIAIQGGIVIDMRGLNRIIEIDEENLVVVAQTGITVHRLNNELEKHGLWWPHDPESKHTSTLGGAIACDNIGTFGTKYGGIIDYLLAIEVVLPTGEIVKIGSKAPFSVSGYPLHLLFIGSEGTLGIITEATLRVYKKPEYRCVELVAFSSLSDAIKSCLQIITLGMDPESINIMAKEGLIYYTRLYKEKFGVIPKIPEDVEAVVAFSFAGSRELSEFQRKLALDVCVKFGGTIIEEPEIVSSFWAEKHTLEYAPQMNPWFISAMKGRYLGIDLCCPLSKVRHLHETYRKLLSKYGLEPASGFFMLCKRIKFSPNCVFTVNVNDSPEEVRKAQEFICELAEYAVKLGGTVSSSRGVGAAPTRNLLYKEHSPEALTLMRKLKRMLDPNNIMNPGKKFPCEA